MTPRCTRFPILVLTAALLSGPGIADPAAPLPTQTAPTQTAQGQTELDDWNAIKTSTKAEDYQAYLDKYPNGNFTDLAKLRLKKYAPAPAAAPAEPPLDPQLAEIAYWNSIKTSKDP